MNFTDPLLISKVSEDQIIIVIKNRDLFISKESGKQLAEDKIRIGAFIPK